ncbi:unnamed protein product [Gongylonema pulchrum]|uniref:HMG box domain-containing protein n=1 Tax=Gongylonema pulchrum TaxID=637853 RepID=A0A183DRN5_9BILA|nr:unnamed protein product [Gongylonema pulchrum]
MFSLLSVRVRCLAVPELLPALRRCFAAASGTGVASGKFGRLPPGYGKTTAFGIYVKENFASRPDEQPTEVFSNLTRQWKGLSEDDKKKYFDEARRVNEQKRLKLEAMSEAEREELQRQGQSLREARLKRRIRLERRKKREDGIQRPMSGWTLFVKEKAVKGASAPDKKQQDVIRELAATWKSLPEDAKNASHFAFLSLPISFYTFCAA